MKIIVVDTSVLVGCCDCHRCMPGIEWDDQDIAACVTACDAG
jgi:hypothetical protein